MSNKLGIYIHIPFCVKKCNYCDFLSFGKIKEDEYTTALCLEIESFKAYAYKVDTIFIGGGTPSILAVKNMYKIFNSIKKNFTLDDNCEISIEVNPATFDKEKLNEYMNLGINRISIGLQSTDDDLLKKLGRIHTYKDFEIGYDMAKNIGFNNINVDLMAALPNQTIEKYTDSLYSILKKKPEHISSYGLIIEEGTKFYKLYNENNGTNTYELPSEDECIKFYEKTNEILGYNSYKHYEISNYAKKGYECRHNLKYWNREDYVGFGLGASGCLGNIRFKNTTDFSKYISNSNIREKEELSSIDIDNEILMLGLRLCEGFDINRLSCSLDDEKVEKFIKDELLLLKNGKIRLTDKGREISNYIISELMI